MIVQVVTETAKQIGVFEAVIEQVVTESAKQIGVFEAWLLWHFLVVAPPLPVDLAKPATPLDNHPVSIMINTG